MIHHLYSLCERIGINTRHVSADWAVKAKVFSNQDTAAAITISKPSLACGFELLWQSPSHLPIETAKVNNPILRRASRLRKTMSRKLGDFGDNFRNNFPTSPRPLQTAYAGIGADIRSGASSVYEDDVVEQNSMYEAARPAPKTPSVAPHGMVDQMMDELSGYERYLKEQEPSGEFRLVVEDALQAVQDGTQTSDTVSSRKELWPGYLAGRSADKHPGSISPGQLSLTSQYSHVTENAPPRESPSRKGQAGYNPHAIESLRRQKSWTPSEMIEQYSYGWDTDNDTPIRNRFELREQAMLETDTRGFDKNVKGLHIEPRPYPLTHSRVDSPGEGMPHHVPPAGLVNESPIEGKGFSHSWPPPERGLSKSNLFGSRDRQKTHRGSFKNLFPPRVTSMPQKVSPREKLNHKRGNSEAARKQTKSPFTPFSRMEQLKLSPTYPPSIPYAATKSSGRPTTPTSAEIAAAIGRTIVKRGPDGFYRTSTAPRRDIPEHTLRPPNYLMYGAEDGGWI